MVRGLGPRIDLVDGFYLQKEPFLGCWCVYNPQGYTQSLWTDIGAESFAKVVKGEKEGHPNG